MTWTLQENGTYVNEAGEVSTPNATSGMPAPKNGALNEIGTGIKRGAVVELPKMLGMGMKATGRPGDTLYDAGQGMVDSAEERGKAPENQLNPDGHGWFVNALASGGEMLAPSAVGMAAAVPLALAGAPTAALAAGAVATGGLFGASQFQDTYEHVQKATGDDKSAFKAGLLSGAIEAGGEGLAAYIGGKFVTRAGSAIVGKTLDSGLKGMAAPGILKSFASGYAKTLGVEVGTEMGQNAGESAVEQAYGVKEANPWESAKAAIAPTFGLTMLLAPFGLHANIKQARQIKNDVATITDGDVNDYQGRSDAVNRLGTLLDNSPPPGMTEKEWATQVNDWRMTALEAANSGQPIDSDTLLSGGLKAKAGQFAAAKQFEDKAEQDAVVKRDPEAQKYDDFGDPIAAPLPITKGATATFGNGNTPGTVVDVTDTSVTIKHADDGSLTTLNTPEGMSSVRVVPPEVAAEAATASAHASGLNVGDPVKLGGAAGTVVEQDSKFAGKGSVSIRMADGSIRHLPADQVHTKLSSDSPKVQGNMKTAYEATPTGAAVKKDAEKEAKKVAADAEKKQKADEAAAAKKPDVDETNEIPGQGKPFADVAGETVNQVTATAVPVVKPTDMKGENRGQSTSQETAQEVLKVAAAVKAAPTKSEQVGNDEVAAKIESHLKNATPEQRVSAMEELAKGYESDAKAKTASQKKKHMAKVARAYANQLKEQENGKSSNVGEGAKPQPTPNEGGPGATPAVKGDDAPNAQTVPEVKTNSTPKVEDKPVRKEAEVKATNEDNEKAAKSYLKGDEKRKTVNPKDKTDDNLVTQRKANGERLVRLTHLINTGGLSTKTARSLGVARKGVADEIENISKELDARRQAKIAEQKLKDSNKPKPESLGDTNRLLPPDKGWEQNRVEQAKAAGIDAESWWVPKWDVLSKKLKDVWVEGKRTYEEFKDLAKKAHREVAQALSDRVALTVEAEIRSERDALREIYGMLDLVNLVIKFDKGNASTREMLGDHIVAEYNRLLRKSETKMLTTVQQVREALGADLYDIMPKYTLEQIKEMDVERRAQAFNDMTPLQKAIAKSMATVAKKEPTAAEVTKATEEMAATRERNKAKGKVDATGRGKLEAADLTEAQQYVVDRMVVELNALAGAAGIVGKVRKDGVETKPFNVRDAREMFGMLDAASKAYTNEGIKNALIAAHGTNDMAMVMDAVRLHASGQPMKALASAFRSMVGGMKVVYQDVVMPGAVRADGEASQKHGNFSTIKNEATYYKGGENAHVVLHEAAHGLSAYELRKAEAERLAGGSPKSQDAVRRAVALRNLEALRGFLEGRKELAGQYAFKNNAEFIAEVWTNAKFQSLLKSIEIPAGMLEQMPERPMTAFDAIVSIMKHALGLADKHTSALSQALDVTGEFFVPNTEVTAPRLIADAVKRRGVQSFDSLSTPSAAFAETATGVGEVISNAKSTISKAIGRWDTVPKLRQLGLYLSTTKNMESNVNTSKDLHPLQPAFDLWFKADELKTRVIGHLNEFLYANHLSTVQVALSKMKDSRKINADMGHAANEISLISEEIGYAIDPRKDFAGNKAAHPTLDPALRDRVNALKRTYMDLSPEVQKLIERGFMATRKAHIEFSASRLLSALQNTQHSPSSAAAAAETMVNKYGKLLDVLAPASGTTITDPKLFMDAKSSELDKHMRDAFDDIHRVFGGEDLQEAFDAMAKEYKRSVASPYQFQNRPGNYFVSFDVANTTPANIGNINKALEPFGVKIGGFPGGSKHVYMKMQSQIEMNATVQALTKLGAAIEGKVEAGKTSDAGRMATAFGAASAVNKLRESLIARYEELRQTGSMTQDMKVAKEQAIAFINSSFIDLIEGDSARTTMTKRKGIPGADTDYQKTFAKRGEFYVSLISNQYAQPHFDKSFRDMKAEITELQSNPATHDAGIRGQEVMDELTTRTNNAMNPVDAPIVRTITAFGYHFFLSLSPAFALVNLLQPSHLTLPLIGGRYGFVKSSMGIMNASAMAFKIIKKSWGKAWAEGGFFAAAEAKLDLEGLGLTPGQVAMVQHMIEGGTLSSSMAHELGRMAEGDDRRLANAAKAMGVMTHYSEVMNRLTAGLAAYNMATENKYIRKDKTDMSKDEDAKIKYAIGVVNQTQFLYSDHNTARAIGRHGIAGKLTPMLASFQNYAFQMMEHYIRLVDQGWINKSDQLSDVERKEARKALYGTLGMTSIIAGTMGLPFANVVAAAANGLAGDDDKEDIRNQYRNFLEMVFGKDVAEVVAHGAVRVAGIDISASSGHQDLLPGTRFLADRRKFEDKVKDGSLTLMGPGLNAALDVVGGLSHIAEGNLQKGFETALPRSLKGYFKAGALVDQGAFTDKAGNKLPIPVDDWNILQQSLGFTPAKKAEHSEANFYYQAEQNLTKQAKAKMVNDAVKAYENGDMEEFAQQRLAIQEYNMRNPMNPITDLASSLTGRARGRAYAAMQPAAIIDRNAKHLPQISQFSWANTRNQP